MSLKEHVAQELESLTDSELRRVAEYVARLKSNGTPESPSTLSPSEVEALYREFAEEDRELAEAGMDDYARFLEEEDRA